MRQPRCGAGLTIKHLKIEISRCFDGKAFFSSFVTL